MEYGIDTDLMTHQGFLYLAVAIGFSGFVWLDYKASGGTPAPPVTTNYGSRMFYAIWNAVLSGGTILGVTAINVGAFKLFPGRVTPDAYFLSYPAFMLLIGACYARAALERVRDAGKSRKAALLALVPFANLVLFSAPPENSPTRPPYVPSSTALRFIIGLFAFVMIVVANTVERLSSDTILEAQVAQRIEQIAEDQRAGLPVKMDAITTLSDIRVNSPTKTFTYVFVLTEPRPSKAELESFMLTNVKPESAEIWCRDPMVSEFRWTVWYRYFDESDSLLGEVPITINDCLNRPNG